MLTFERDGAERFPLAAVEILRDIEAIVSGLEPDRAGIRLHAIEGLPALLASGAAIGSVASGAIGAAARPVRAILFDKTATANWSLGWHQDRTIVVAERREVKGYGPWTVKAGLLHVAPPFELLARMVTLRVHLDPVSADNAPLLIAPGSHRAGRVAEQDIDAVVAACGVATCRAERGDVWLYATPILHASEAAARPQRRRVLQVDYAAEDLPYGLEWLGI
ncbi:MAG: phytanoyl-CoA dioxygenase family protein [Sphingomonas sp.]